MNYLLIGLVCSLTFGGSCYLATQNLYSSISLFAVTILYFVIIVKPSLEKGKMKINRFHQCYQFINSFIVALSIKESLSSSFKAVYESQEDHIKEIMDGIEDLNEEQKLAYLSKYFRFHVYRLFCDVISIWNEQGGNILSMTHYVTNQARVKEEYLISVESMHKSKVVEFVILWTFAIGILISLRFALSQFFQYVLNSLFYQISIVAYFLFILFSIQILVLKINKIDLEGWNDNDK